MFEREPGINPQQALWQSVLLRTVEDALIGVSQESNRETRIHLCKKARRYLTEPSRDLSTVCGLCGLDMQAVIERMRKQIANAPTPEALASNPRQNAATFAKTKAPAKPKLKPVPFRDQVFTINGTTRTAAEWCLRTGISIATASQRIGKGLDAELSFTMTKAEAQANSRARYEAATKIAQVKQADRSRPSRWCNFPDGLRS